MCLSDLETMTSYFYVWLLAIEEIVTTRLYWFGTTYGENSSKIFSKGTPTPNWRQIWPFNKTHLSVISFWVETPFGSNFLNFNFSILPLITFSHLYFSTDQNSKVSCTCNTSFSIVPSLVYVLESFSPLLHDPNFTVTVKVYTTIHTLLFNNNGQAFIVPFLEASSAKCVGFLKISFVIFGNFRFKDVSHASAPR